MTNLVAIILAEIFLSSPEIWQGSFYSGEVGFVKNYFLKMAAVQAANASIKDVMVKIYTGDVDAFLHTVAKRFAWSI